jgi:carbamoyl-phosphate synthase large subunit
MRHGKILNILFTCAGRKVSLIKEFRRALTQLDIEGSLIGTDASPFSAALSVCDYRYIVPRVDDPTYIQVLLALCREHDIKLLIPLIDLDLLILSEHQEMFSAHNILVLVSSPVVVRICRDKRATAQFFDKHNIPTVRILDFDSMKEPEIQFPLFIKPSNGSGSIKSFNISNKYELEFFLRYVPDPIVQEFANGQEHTIDALSDLSGNVINAVPRRRIEVRAGEISKGATVKDWRIIEATVHLLQHLKAIGPTTVQCFFDGDRIQFTEINPRFGGGIPLTIAAGADYPTQIIRMALGEHIKPCIGDFIDDLYMFRYEEAIYISGVGCLKTPS